MAILNNSATNCIGINPIMEFCDQALLIVYFGDPGQNFKLLLTHNFDFLSLDNLYKYPKFYKHVFSFVGLKTWLVITN